MCQIPSILLRYIAATNLYTPPVILAQGEASVASMT